MPVPADIPRLKFTSKDVATMMATGILREGEPVELIAGELIVTPNEGPLHATLAEAIARRLRRAYPESHFVVREGHPLVLSDVSEPEPDLVVVPGPLDQFFTRHPRGDEAVLVIEIAHSSLKLDRAMAEFYARAGVRHYWLVDVVGRVIEHHSEPRPSGLYSVRGIESVLPLPETVEYDLDLEALLPPKL